MSNARGMSTLFIDHVQRMLAKLNEAHIAAEEVARDADEPIHMIAVYRSRIDVLGELLNQLGTLVYSDTTQSYHITIRTTATQTYMLWADDVDIL
jgi:hypothetical protein